jgi:L-fucose isomerase-like protein
MTFHTGSDPATELTDEQIRKQLKMYVAAARMADDLGCDAIGIQYQQGLKDLLPASDLAEGLLNNTERPPVFERDGERELCAGEPIPHFNEVDEGAGLDALVTNRVWDALDYPPETTLHDVRWGEPYEGEYVWVFEISGSVPPAHLGGYEHADSYRQPPMFFPAGGGTIKGYSKPGEIVWSRVYVEDDTLRADVGRGRAVELPDEEAERRSQATDPQWPIMHAVTYGVSRDQMMARHKSNHVQVAYAPDADAANRALAAKAAMFDEMGLEVFVCGDVG